MTELVEEHTQAADAAEAIDLSVVIPCLNEADTIGIVIAKALQGIAAAGVTGEVVVGDNGSTDGSQAIAEKLGARVVAVPERGYGAALMGGIEAARGRWVLMGDADDSYDFLEIPRFVAHLREGYELVQGCRLPSGGGEVKPGAMPFLHRWLGNPGFSILARLMFGATVNDVHCGMRAFTKEAHQRLGQRCTGMEFATEMLIKSSLTGLKTAEVPITLHPDGRKSHGPHLRTFRDGWRHLRLYLLFSPRWLYLLPGLLLSLLGLVGYGLAMPRLTVFGATFDLQTLLVASMLLLVGAQLVMFALATRVFAVYSHMLPDDPKLDNFFTVFTLEKGVIFSLVVALLGLVLLASVIFEWSHVGFGPLEAARTMRTVIPAVTLITLGVQGVFSSFFISMLGMRRK
jgi:glycosyltransferase involved in cell wall biosynthesis